MPWMAGRIASTARGVNAREMSLRTRVCAGPSIAIIQVVMRS